MLKDSEGRIGVGDCAPLPGFSRESAAVAQAILSEVADELIVPALNRTADIPSIYEDITQDPKTAEIRKLAPSALFAASTALWDLTLQVRGESLSMALNPLAAKSVAVNGLLDDGEPSEMRSQTARVVQQGRTSIKMKLGIGSVERDVARVKAVTEVHPDVTLRLDVNGAWTAEVLSGVLPRLPRNRIEFIEQPLPPGLAATAYGICRKAGVRLALDEDIAGAEEALQFIHGRSCDVVVLKPMIIGGIHSCAKLALDAQEAGIEVIYTSSWESDVGVAATLHLAASLGPHPAAMGLSTAGMISEGIVRTPLRVENGYIRVPDGPGLGLELAPEIISQLG